MVEMSYPAGTRPSRAWVHTIPMTVADKEYSYTLPQMVLTFLMHMRDDSSFRLAFEEGKVADSVDPYFTVPANSGYVEPEIQNTRKEGITFYFASSNPDKVMEFLLWA